VVKTLTLPLSPWERGRVRAKPAAQMVAEKIVRIDRAEEILKEMK